MQFSRIVSFFLAFFALGAFAFATPVAVEKRDNAAVEKALNTLSATVKPILAEINAQASTGVVSEASLLPLVEKIDAAIDISVDALVVLQRRGMVKRQSDDDIATLVSGIITDVTAQLDVVVSLDPTLVSVTSLIDVPFNTLLETLDVLIEGILATVSVLLFTISGILASLGLTNVLNLLGFL